MSSKHHGKWWFAIVGVALVIWGLPEYIENDNTTKVSLDVPPGQVESLRIGIPLQPTSALALIALDQGYIHANGIDPAVTYYPSGKRALNDGFYQGKLDVAICSDVPATLGVLRNKKLKIVAALFGADNVNRIVARPDSGIANPAELVGMRIATQKASAVHYFLHLFLLEHKIPKDQVELKFLKAEQLVDSIVDGQIDAFSMREPYVSRAVERLSGNSLVFEDPGLYQQFDLLIASPRLVEEQAEIIERFLKALLAAEQLTITNPELAIDIVAKKLGVERQQISQIWPTLDVSVSLGQSHLLTLENQARWAIQDGLTETKSVPDFLESMYPDSLTKLRPESVTIIH